MKLNLNHLGTTLKGLPGTCFSFVCDTLKNGCQKTQAAALGALAFLSSCLSKLCRPLKNWIFSKEIPSSETSIKTQDVASRPLALPDQGNRKALSTVTPDVKDPSVDLSSFPITIATIREDGSKGALHLTYDMASVLLLQPKIRSFFFPNEVLFRNPSLQLEGLEMLPASKRKSIQIELSSEQFDILVEVAQEVKLQSALPARDLDQFNGDEVLAKALASEEQKKSLKIVENNCLAQELATLMYLHQFNASAYEFNHDDLYGQYVMAQQVKDG